MMCKLQNNVVPNLFRSHPEILVTLFIIVVNRKLMLLLVVSKTVEKRKPMQLPLMPMMRRKKKKWSPLQAILHMPKGMIVYLAQMMKGRKLESQVYWCPTE
jgi:hypothetical protein